jgi:hypothetical protein
MSWLPTCRKPESAGQQHESASLAMIGLIIGHLLLVGCFVGNCARLLLFYRDLRTDARSGLFF